ncbi:Gti1/Pac2 family-domain-containing protein [Gongronella butleri]|nr:Gti1/Pac2 family-domain-containing protein [Gongronella butleri]
MSLTETFYGYIETTTDALLVFEACKRGLLPKITRRLQEKERGYLRSGTVFVFDGRESGIKRWTDGLVWSPSRILGNFLIYRELNGREHHQLKHHHAHHAHGNGAMMDDHLPHALDQRERALVGSLTTSYRFKECGLIKKTISVVVNGSHLHLISYYNKDHVLRNLLPTPSTTPQLAHLAISPELVHRQRFRISPMADAPLNRYEPYALGKNAISASLPSPPTQSPGLDRGYMRKEILKDKGG